MAANIDITTFILCIWLALGVLSLIICTIFYIIEPEIRSIYNEVFDFPPIVINLPIFILAHVVLGPAGIWVIINEFIKIRKERLYIKRATCGWWELKKYGGKY